MYCKFPAGLSSVKQLVLLSVHGDTGHKLRLSTSPRLELQNIFQMQSIIFLVFFANCNFKELSLKGTIETLSNNFL